MFVQGMGDRKIGRSCVISHVTVGKYRSKVADAGLTYDDIEVMDDCKLIRLLKIGSREATRDVRYQPEWEHAE